LDYLTPENYRKLCWLGLAILLVGCLIYATGCAYLDDLITDPGPDLVIISGQVVGDKAVSDGGPKPDAVVRIDGEIIPLDGKARFQAQAIATERRRVTVRLYDYAVYDAWIPARQTVNLGQIVLAREGPPPQEWDFANTRLLGWSDPVSGAYYYPDKARAIDADTAKYGSNCGVVNVNRSNGRQYHSGNCAGGRGWWKHIHDDGWLYQFCKKSDGGGWDTGHAHFPYENIHDSNELSEKWLDQMEARVRSLMETGQWALVNLWCPYDNKWYRVNWYYWTEDCSESPFTVGPNSRWYHPKQEAATKALLERIKGYPNVVILDNWEEMGVDDSVDLEWKQLCFGWVQDVMPGVPYFCYVGDDTKNIPAVINWINHEPRVAGVNTHYRLFDDVRGGWGLSASKRVLHTEEMDLNAPATFRAVQWCLTNDDETCMYYGNYRDFKRGDNGPDTDKALRDRWNPQIKALFD